MKKSDVTIYQTELSPYCIPIVAIFKALGVPHRTVNISHGDRVQIIKLTGGAYYQVPLLVHGRRPIYESGAETIDVPRYVDKTFAGDRLFPAPLEGLQQILVPRIENELEAITFRLIDPFYADSIKDLVERTMLIRFKERRFGRGCVEQWRKAAPELRKQARVALMPFDLMARNGAFLLGDVPVYTDYALLGVIGNMTYKGWNKLPPGLSGLEEWLARIRAWKFPA